MEQFQDNDFAALYEAQEQKKTRIQSGDKVSGKVIMVGRDTVFVDLGVRSDGIIDRQEFDDGEGGCTVAEGDIIEAYCMGWSSEGVKLQLKLKAGSGFDAVLEDAFAAKMPVEGKVTAERKGGFTVQVSQSEAFCPFSQIDARGIRKEPAEYIGQSFTFRITEYAEEGRNIVLSRRVLLDEESEKKRAELKVSLAEGDILSGKVVKLQPYGAFVDLGGLEGMVHISEISWQRNVAIEELLKEGDQVSVKVLKLEWAENEEERDRIALSIKQAEQNPWETITEDENLQEGKKVTAKVSRLSSFGAFIELKPGIEGLAHISRLGSEKRIEHPSEVLQEGEEVEVTILEIDAEKRRISLCIGDPPAKIEDIADLSAEEEKELIREALAGEKIVGIVESQKPFGLFVRLPDGRNGLLHISQIELPEGSEIPVRQLYRTYPLNSEIEVVIREINGDRISLTTPEVLEKERDQERDQAIHVKDEKDEDFGSIGDIFAGLDL